MDRKQITEIAGLMPSVFSSSFVVAAAQPLALLINCGRLLVRHGSRNMEACRVRNHTKDSVLGIGRYSMHERQVAKLSYRSVLARQAQSNHERTYSRKRILVNHNGGRGSLFRSGPRQQSIMEASPCPSCLWLGTGPLSE